MATDPYNPSTWRLQTRAGIPYRILEVSGESEQSSSTTTEVYLIQASQILNFILESFPPPITVQGISFFNNRRMPGLPGLTTRRVRWERFIDGLPIDPFRTDLAAPPKTYPDLARVTIEYSNEREKDENDPESLITITGSVAAEVLHVALPKAELKDEQARATGGSSASTATKNTRMTLSSMMLIPEIEWTVTWDQVERKFFRETLLPRLKRAMGKVNSKTWTLLFQDDGRSTEYNSGGIENPIPNAETLLFVGFTFEEVFHAAELLPPTGPDEPERGKSKREQLLEQHNPELLKKDESTQNKQPVKLELKFLEKRIEESRSKTTGTNTAEWIEVYGHNHIWDEDSGSWRRVYVRGQGTTRNLYQHYDFNEFFQAEVDEGNA